MRSKSTMSARLRKPGGYGLHISPSTPNLQLRITIEQRPKQPNSERANTLQTADACLLILDLGDPACVEKVEGVDAVLREKRITLSGRWEPEDKNPGDTAEVDEDPFALRLPAMLLANKADLLADVDTELRAFLELTGLRYPALAVSVTTGRGLGEIGPLLFCQLRIVRVHTKAPGRPPDRNRPFTVRRGQTVENVAQLVHKDLARSLKYARVWSKSGFDGQHVGRDYPLADGDLIELHT